MNDLSDVIREARELNRQQVKDHQCRYCGKTFAKEKTLTAHLCEPKRRAQQKSEQGVQIGYNSYVQFYEYSQGSSKNKNYEEFSKSPYYNAFVKFGRYMASIRAINVRGYIQWLLKNNKKLDHWCKDAWYNEFLIYNLQTEHPQDALSRSIRTMEEWAEQKQSVFSHYFLYASPNIMVKHISDGRISPWVIYNSSSGLTALEKLSEEQIEMIFPYINPELWQPKLRRDIANTEWCKEILQEAGI